jgi:NCK adaptor protein
MGDDLVAKYDYTAQDELELSLTKNERLILLDDAKQWWKVQNNSGEAGFVPSNFVKRVKPSLLSSLRNTLGRRKGNNVVQSSLRNGAGRGDLDENNGYPGAVESQFCDKCPALAKYAYTAQQRDELSLNKADRVMVLEKSSDGWWKGCKDDGQSGWFPSNYVQEEADNNTYADPADRGSGDSTTPPTIETVAALYPYTSDNTEELNFAKDEELEVIEKPLGDPDWWRARNRHGETGLIPRNYVQTIATGAGGAVSSQSSSSLSAHSQGASSSRTPSGGGGGGNGAGVRARYNLTGPFAHKDWFYGTITRGHAERLLNTSAKLGDFLIRESETNVSILISILECLPVHWSLVCYTKILQRILRYQICVPNPYQA